jgi:hypothetical protein
MDADESANCSQALELTNEGAESSVSGSSRRSLVRSSADTSSVHHSLVIPKRCLSLAHTGRWYWLTKLISCDGHPAGSVGACQSRPDSACNIGRRRAMACGSC